MEASKPRDDMAVRDDFLQTRIASTALQKRAMAPPANRNTINAHGYPVRGALQPACAAHTIDFAKLPER